MYNIWNQFDFITVRDEYIKYIFDTIGIKCEFQLCPSYNTARHLQIAPQQGKYNLLVYYDILRGIGGEVMPKENGEKWANLMKDIITKYKIDKIIAIKKLEVELARSSNIKVDLYAEDDVHSYSHEKVRSLLNCLAAANFVISTRVHLAIPSICLNKKTTIVPFDTRYLTAKGAIDYFQENSTERII